MSSLLFNTLLIVMTGMLLAVEIVHGQEEASETIDVIFQYKSSVVLDCTEKGLYVYNVTGNGTHAKLVDSKKVTVEGQKVTITDLRREEIKDGDYSCRTEDNKLKKKFVIKVAPYLYQPEKLSITITEGGKVDMECKMLYGQENNVEWTWSRSPSNNTLQAGEKYLIEKNDNQTKLTILNVEDNDKGLYYCSVKNNFGSHVEMITLRVKDQLAALWPFLAIVAEVIILCLIILIYEKRCNKKPSTSEEDHDASQNLMGKESSDVKKRSVKA